MASKQDLTGGTGDVNPQLLTITVTQTAADTTTQAEQPVPVPRVGVKKGRSIVIELLWLTLNWDTYTQVAGSITGFTALLSTASSAVTTSDPRTIWADSSQIHSSAIGGGPQDAPLYELTHNYDFTDKAGHGILVGTDSLYFTVATGLTARANSASVKIAYRFKEVALEEYIGIVASQQ